MVFSSTVFLFCFLPCVLILYFLAHRLSLKNTILFLSSLFFYAWGEGFFVFFMIFSIGVNYFFGLAIEDQPGPRKKFFLVLALVTNLSPLIFFKYTNLIVSTLCPILNIREIPLDIHLPIGVSFFTLQEMSYLFDIYRGKVNASRKPGAVALYVSFFPQLIAGPIIRYRDVEEQISKRSVTVERFSSGVMRFVVGLAKKVLIANTVATAADGIFSLPEFKLSPGVAWLGLLCYTVQIYFDFSGYSDMAIGLGRLFGFEFLENFNYPYRSFSVREFWKRWHISLSTWFRDYLYVPLGGSHRTPAMTYRNLIGVFLLCGFWHGARWTFVLWGFYHGFFLILERTRIGRLIERIPFPLRWIYAFFVVVVGWVFFRSPDASYAGSYVRVLFGFLKFQTDYTVADFLSMNVLIALVAGLAGAMPIIPAIKKRILEAVSKRAEKKDFFEGLFLTTHFACFVGLLLVCVVAMAMQTYNPFIYFRF